MRKTESYINHVGGVINPNSTREILSKLGFCYGDNRNDPTNYLVYKQGYAEFYLKDSGFEDVEAKENSPLLSFSVWYGVDSIEAMRDSLVDAGYPCGDVLDMTEFRRAKHGPRKGKASVKGLIIESSAPFYDGVVCGLVKHCSPELLHDNVFTQINGTRGIHAAVFVCKDEAVVNSAADYFDNFYKITKGRDVQQENYKFNVFLTGDEYAEILGKPYTGGHEIDLAALEFEGGDMVYLMEQCEEHGIRYIQKGLDLIVDTTSMMGIYMVFHCDLNYDNVDLLKD